MSMTSAFFKEFHTSNQHKTVVKVIMNKEWHVQVKFMNIIMCIEYSKQSKESNQIQVEVESDLCQLTFDEEFWSLQGKHYQLT